MDWLMFFTLVVGLVAVSANPNGAPTMVFQNLCRTMYPQHHDIKARNDVNGVLTDDHQEFFLYLNNQDMKPNEGPPPITISPGEKITGYLWSPYDEEFKGFMIRIFNDQNQSIGKFLPFDTTGQDYGGTQRRQCDHADDVLTHTNNDKKESIFFTIDIPEHEAQNTAKIFLRFTVVESEDHFYVKFNQTLHVHHHGPPIGDAPSIHSMTVLTLFSVLAVAFFAVLRRN